MSKVSKTVVARRVEEVLRIRLDGAKFWDVMRYVAEKHQAGEPPWNRPDGEKPFAERTVWWYVQQADELLKETFRNERGLKRLRRRHLAQRRNLYAKAVSQGDIRTTLAVLDSEVRLLGLDDEILRDVKSLKKEMEEIKKGIPNPKGEADERERKD